MSCRLDGLFLDFFGTLAAGDREAVEAICAEIIGREGLSCSAAALAVAWGRRFFAEIDQANDHAFRTMFECERRSLELTLNSLGLGVDPLPYVRHLQRYWRNPPLFPEVTGCLSRLPLPVCLVSNVDRADLLAAMETLGLKFDAVVTSEDARSYKPHPGIFQHALRLTGWSAQRVLHVGDSLHSDVAGARRCGLRTVWLDRPGRISDIGTCESHYRIEQLNQLASVIDSHG